MTDDGGIRCMLMRGGTSKGLYLLREDLPDDTAARDDLLLRLMGAPDARQIDGLGGAHPLTSKVAIVGLTDDRKTIEYLFLQLGVGEALVSDRQNCGNLLAGVGQFAVERGLVSATNGEAAVRIRMLNTGATAVARFPIRDGRPTYDGDTAIAGVPGTAAAVRLDFEAIAGSTCGALLPTGSSTDLVEGVTCTLIDHGMPVVVMRADDVGATGYETVGELESASDLRDRVERIRLSAGQLMGLGDVAGTTIPKMVLVAPPQGDGDVSTRSFIPHAPHDAIGVLAAVSVVTACALPGTPGASVLRPGTGDVVRIEHPTGTFDAAVELVVDAEQIEIGRAGILRTARKLMDGTAFPRSAL